MKTDIAVVTAHRTTSSLFNFGLANEEYSSLKCFAVIPFTAVLENFFYLDHLYGQQGCISDASRRTEVRAAACALPLSLLAIAFLFLCR